MDLQYLLIVALIGIAAGMLSGLLGLGGAIIIIPALIFFLGYSQQTAQGTALIMMVLPVGVLAAYQYYKEGYVEIKTALIMAVFFFIGGYFGARFATEIPQSLLKKLFAIMLIILAIKMLFFEKAIK
ncbi:sulfite exporter TauE/SafE family protein [Hanamia caeni]|jgi:uncharacterized membrane protein YfcA|uniref:Probable membrane transporter protein n=1 Tax=Hanamia caeni TaxID=2294116 RepID=A0A3M9NFJ4_9BACT|nr:sulfite exporter TauE/SafE family protein [Hanamia caeni]RNI35748.1 sulfite exporter TauE/SafE family protein [Hanamia caeni]